MDEKWTIVLEEKLGDGAPGAGTTQEGRAQKEAAETIKQSGPAWANVGKFAGGLLGVVGTLAFVIQMIRRSRIFTTFMDSFLLIFSSFIDIMMIPLIPVFGAALRLIVKLLPLGYEIQKKIADFIRDPWGGIKDLFAGISGGIQTVMSIIGKVFSGLGASNLGELFKSIGEKLGKAFEQITPIFSVWIDKIRQIWSDDSTTFWEKIVLTAGTSWDSIVAASKILWDTIKNIWNEDIMPFIREKWENFYSGTLVPVWNKFVEDTLIPSFETATSEVWKYIKDQFDLHIISPFINFIQIALPAALGAAIGGALLGPLGAVGGGLLGGGIAALIKWLTKDRGQFGIAHVPQTGMYMLHRGEEVIPSSARSIYNQNRAISINNIYNITTASPFVARGISRNLDEEVRGAFLRI